MHDCVGVIIGGSNTLMDPCRSNIGSPDPCDPCGVDAYAGAYVTWPFHPNHAANPLLVNMNLVVSHM